MGLKNPFSNRPKPSNGDAEHYQWDDDAAADDLAAKLAAVGENDDFIELESDEAERREAAAAKIPVVPPMEKKLPLPPTPDAVKALRDRMSAKKQEPAVATVAKPVTEVGVDQAAVRVAQIIMDPEYRCWVDGRVLRAVKITDGHITQVEIEFARMSQRTSKLIG